jgi:hypothetical protein
MTQPLVSTYQLYVDYVNRLNEDVASDSHPMIRGLEGLEPMSLAEFTACWQAWGKTLGLQQAWLRRFEMGYEETAIEERKRIREAIRSSSRRVLRRAS